jgi:hypothetical protein
VISQGFKQAILEGNAKVVIDQHSWDLLQLVVDIRSLVQVDPQR